jgi:hypothetical protein
MTNLVRFVASLVLVAACCAGSGPQQPQEKGVAGYNAYVNVLLASLGVQAATKPQRQPKLLVLGAGHPRTGTMTQKRVLEYFGYKVCHTEDVMGQHLGDLYKKALHSDEHMDAFVDRILGLGYNATSDLLFAYQTPALLKRFPDAKVILSTRPDPARWGESLKGAVSAFKNARAFPFSALIDLDMFDQCYARAYGFAFDFPPCSDWRSRLPWVIGCRQNVVPNMKMETFYEMHNQRVRDVVPKAQLLEYSVEQGWEPVARFLARPLPTIPFPAVNEQGVGGVRAWLGARRRAGLTPCCAFRTCKKSGWYLTS